MTSYNLDVQLVTDERVPFDKLLRIVDKAVSAGVGVIQLRDKQANARRLLEQTLSLAQVIAGRSALIVNDRLDVVLAAQDHGAHIDGVHLGQDDIPPATARHLLGPEALIGWTANETAHLAAVAAMPPQTLNYLGVGVIRATTTKPDHPPALGIDGFADFAAKSPLPSIAIGGVTIEDVAALRAAGATGVAVVSAICGATDPEATAREFVEATRR